MFQKGTAFFLLPFYEAYVTSYCCFEILLVMASPMLFSRFTYFKSFDTEYCSAFANWQHSIDPRVVSDSSGRQLTCDGSCGREARDPSRRHLAPPPMAAGDVPPCHSTHLCPPLIHWLRQPVAGELPLPQPPPTAPPTYCWASLLPGI
jgi:hypothetical protein